MLWELSPDELPQAQAMLGTAWRLGELKGGHSR